MVKKRSKPVNLVTAKTQSTQRKAEEVAVVSLRSSRLERPEGAGGSDIIE
jgi:hypothetical protein